MTKLEELRAAFEAATPGEWKVREERKYKACNSKVDCEAGYAVAEGYASPSAKLTYNQLWAEAEGNTTFITLVHNMLPQLLKVVDLLDEMQADYGFNRSDEKRCATLIEVRALLDTLR